MEYETHSLRYWRKVRTAGVVIATVLGLVAMLFAGGAPFHAN